MLPKQNDIDRSKGDAVKVKDFASIFYCTSNSESVIISKIKIKKTNKSVGASFSCSVTLKTQKDTNDLI